ncbi:response regulator transcription factor [Arthrobacter sp. ISL-69]|uniref:helix-turn-helix transcriptional regulator n=1 Tax=Arthrobacter sp. ISL-69 TaxID=2819113 RepID=UPI001BEA22CA|nr:response regulator transcription factor [Arthrobacter sp. ISL-69]MBT2535910.1 response regulator transcription factor [Arthrobacter sp. ISL-69]
MRPGFESGIAQEREHEAKMMDIRLLCTDGSQAIAAILDFDPAAMLLAVARSSSRGAAVAAVRAGASGLLFKSDNPQDFTRAIRKVHSGQYVLSPLASRDVINFVRSIPTIYSVFCETGGAALSPREESVVKMLTQGMSNAEMSRALFVSEATVKAHLSSVMTKWGARDRTQVVIRALESGMAVVHAH